MIPTSTNVTFTIKTKAPAENEAVVVFVTQGAKAADGAGAAALAGELAGGAAARLLNAGVAKGKLREVMFDLIEDHGRMTRVYIAGLGEASKLTLEFIRQSAAAVTKALAKHKMSRAAVIVPHVENLDRAAVAEAVVSGILLADFDYEEYKGTANKKDDDAEPRKPLAITLVAAEADQKIVKSAADRARAICDGQNFCRTIGSRPGNDINPPTLAKVAQEMSKEAGLTCTVMDEKQLAKLGMGGILGVGAGSIASPPRLIVLEHKPAGAKKSGRPLLVVGKAITFDTGGISIKPADKMGKMIFDKCGGMAVLGLMYAVAKLDIPLHIVGILTSAENAISSQAYRPGDILRMYNGVTVEVTNTDAEGRLVLGDALAWGIETYKPTAVVDLATLTGGVITALGKTMAGVMSNNDDLVADLIRAGESAGEKMWRLPLWEEHREQMKSEPADIVNSAGREAHPLQGGAFLSYFVPTDGSVPWAHLDIAGVADTEKELPCYAKGATGWGVRTLVNWVSEKAGKR